MKRTWRSVSTQMRHPLSRDWTARHHVPLIHFSTDYIFDGSGDRPWREDGPTGPLSVYGASKLAGEQAIAEAGCPHLIVRTSWVYAAKGTNFLRTIARLAGERKELRIVADQIGAPTSASGDCASCRRDFARRDCQSRRRICQEWRRLSISPAPGQTSWQGFASAIVAGLRTRGVKLEVESVAPILSSDYPTKARRPGNSRLDLSRLEGVFGVVTPSWNEALAVELDEFTR